MLISDLEVTRAVAAVVDARPPADRESLTLDHGFRFGDAVLSPSPADAVAAEFARAVQRHRNRDAILRHLSGAAPELVGFSVAVVGRNLTDDVRKNQPPGFSAAEYLVANLLDHAAGVSEADARVSMNISGQTRFAYAVEKYFGALPADFMVHPVRRAIENIVEQVSRALERGMPF
ncbi:hypothetical protein [Ideonella sp. BN130291]|uniref:hypothetical protein n=1 Tax=Ideonella sp. BN130291 TaxID=3112940 RepID=UPI002E274E78|nr:hypothetical protein [Ideonella sp. BN130291]